MRKNYNTACIAQRKQLQQNGFIVLPLQGKRPTFKGWTKLESTPSWLASFDRKTKYNNTGVRCDNLIVFDFDIDNPDLIDQASMIVEQICGSTDYCRFGRGDRFSLFYRMDGHTTKSARTGKYGDAHYQVELLMGPGRQTVVWGKHPDTGEDFSHEGDKTLLNSAWSDLPPLAPETALEALAAVEDLLQATGLPQVRSGRQSGVEHDDVFDLDAATPCQLEDGTELLWGELRQTLDEIGVMGNLQREDGHYGDSNGVHFYLSDIDGAPCAYDFPRDLLHREAPAVEQLAHVLPSAPVRQTLEPNYLQNMLDNWVLLPDESARRIDSPLREYKIRGLTRFKAHETVMVPTKTGDKPVCVVQVWEKHPHCKRADYAALRPDHPDDILFNDRRDVVFNTYRRPEHPGTGGEVSTFYEFIDHLLPDPDECDLFLDWLAYKWAYPGERLHGMVMVAANVQGTGRGTLTCVIERLFGAHYIKPVELRNLTGQTGQGIYNDYLADSLMVYVSEAKQALKADSGKWETRHFAYEQIKQIVDPLVTSTHIIRKGKANTIEQIFTSILVSTNHRDALAIDEDDRRLIVLSNTRIKLEKAANDLQTRIHAWYRDPANVGALARELNQRIANGIAYNPYDNPPMTPAKMAMVQSSKSDIDYLYDQFVDNAEGDVCVSIQIERFMIARAHAEGIDLPGQPGKHMQVIEGILQSRAERFNKFQPLQKGQKWKQLSVSNTPVRPWIIRNFNRWIDEQHNTRIREEILKNGPVGRHMPAKVVDINIRKDSEKSSTDDEK